MRLIAVLLVALAATVSADTCLLNSITLGNGLTLSSPFTQAHRDYFCSCLYTTEWTTITVDPVEPGAALKLTFNGAVISPFYAYTPSPWLYLQQGSNSIVVNVKCADCELDWTVICDRQPPSGGNVIGDPQFTGLKGQSYQIHGVAGEMYNLISDPALQMNAKFVFLNKGECPYVNGVKMTNCWTHPGQYLGEIGIKTVNGEQVLLSSGTAKQGFAGVTLNDRSIGVDERVQLTNGYVIRNGTHTVTVHTPSFTMIFDNSDMFINQQINVNDWSLISSSGIHGLLGQTVNEKVYPNKIKYIEGNVDDYRVNDGIFGNAFVFNRFNKV